MKWVRTLAGLRKWVRQWKQDEGILCLVPTMGYLHEGHLSLVRKARQQAGPNGKVVVSIYVNPAQFGPREDLSTYPRDLERDRRLCRSAGADLVFLPDTSLMYPSDVGGEFSTFVQETVLSRTMEGHSRPGHFQGVTTVLAKLFNLVQPDVAIFGAKDFQQAAVVRRMVRDLAFPLRIVVAPTVRERDGLAMSSRNRYLQGTQRDQATLLIRALREARRLVRSRGSGRSWSAAGLKKRLGPMFEAETGVRLDYMMFFDPVTLQPASRVLPGVQMALAVFVGRTRLIDNMRL